MSDDLALSDMQLRAMLSQQCEAAGGQSAWARQHGLMVSQVSEARSGKREVARSIILAMGLLPVTRYVPIRRGA